MSLYRGERDGEDRETLELQRSVDLTKTQAVYSSRHRRL